MTVNIKTSAAVSLNFDKVQGLRDLKDTALSLNAYCKAASGIIEALQQVPGTNFQATWSLKPLYTRLLGHAENLSVLIKRITNTIELVSAEHWIRYVLGLIKIAFVQVCVCTRFEESVHGCKYQQPCFSARREDNQRHDSCKMDHVFDSGLSSWELCCRKS